MNDVIVRWSKTIGTSAFLATLVATGTGCGALSAAANPKVAWAINDPAPMSVVVRRADVAEKTAQQVDRVLTSTPLNDDSPWLAKVAPQKDEATQALGDIRKHALYAPGSAGQGARIVSAEVWARSLAQLETKVLASPTAATPAPAGAPEPTGDAPADPVAKAAVPEVQSADPKPERVAGKKGGRKSGSSAKSANGKKGSKKTSADDKTAAAPPAAVDPAPSADVAAVADAAPVAPAPVATVAMKYPSLLAAVDKDLGSAWSDIMDKKKAAGDLKTKIAAEETALDVKGVSDADKSAHKKTIEDLEKQVSTLEKDADKLTDAFVPKAKAAAAKASPDARDHFGSVLVNLRQAVDDAKTSNGAAAVRYALAAKTLVDSAKQMASLYVADVVEERTGKRPSLSGFQPGVTMEGGNVAVTINGLSQADLGKTTIGDVTSEVTSRTTKWVGHAMSLLGTISSTKDTLSFEDDVLEALIDGFKSAGWTPPAAATIPEAPVAGATAAAKSPTS